MKLLYAILLIDIALLGWAFGDPPPSGNQSQVFSPDEIILIIDTNAFASAENVAGLIADGGIVYVTRETNTVVSKTTGEPIGATLDGEATNVPSEVLAMPQYEAGAVWRMVYTSAGTNYYLVKTVAEGIKR